MSRYALRRAIATGALAGLAAAAMVAGCGSSSPTSSSSVGHPTQAQAQDRLRQDLVRFADCMRSHGVSGFPDPTAPGAAKEFILSQIPGVDTRSPAFRSAHSVCVHQLPSNGPNAQRATEQVMTQLLQTSRCMRLMVSPSSPIRRCRRRQTRPPTSMSPGSVARIRLRARLRSRTSRFRIRSIRIRRRPSARQPSAIGGCSRPSLTAVGNDVVEEASPWRYGALVPACGPDIYVVPRRNLADEVHPDDCIRPSRRDGLAIANATSR